MLDKRTQQMVRECDKHNAGIKEKANRKAKESMGERIEAGVYALKSGKNPKHYLGSKLYKKIFNS